MNTACSAASLDLEWASSLRSGDEEPSRSVFSPDQQEQ